MKVVNRTSKVPAYIFSRLDEVKKNLSNRGVDIIDLGIGDPDMPTPDFVVDNMANYIKQWRNHNYPPYSGIDEFKKAVCQYYKRTFNVSLDYETEVAALIGSKEGIAHLFLALTDPEDIVLIPDPAYPVYYASAIIAGCNIHKMPLCESNGYLPKLQNIYPDVAKKSKLLVVNYPNNPTGSIANKDFYTELVNFGKENDVVIVNDGAYSSIYRDNEEPISLLQAPNAKDICVEFGTLSKSYNMTGWRIGYIVGNKEIIQKLMIIKTNFDSGQFSAIQYAGVDALNHGNAFISEMNKIYNERRDLVISILNRKGFEVYNSKGTFYVWFKVPNGYKSEEFAANVLENTGVLITPGNSFGSKGEGYCRISLTVDSNKLKNAMERIENLSL